MSETRLRHEMFRRGVKIRFGGDARSAVMSGRRRFQIERTVGDALAVRIESSSKGRMIWQHFIRDCVKNGTTKEMGS